MTVLTAYGFVKPDQMEAFKQASQANKELALAEDGCEKFDYYLSVEDPFKFVFVEEWTTRESLEAHFQTAHFAAFVSASEECLTAPPEIRIFEATLTG